MPANDLGYCPQLLENTSRGTARSYNVIAI